MSKKRTIIRATLAGVVLATLIGISLRVARGRSWRLSNQNRRGAVVDREDIVLTGDGLALSEDARQRVANKCLSDGDDLPDQSLAFDIPPIDDVEEVDRELFDNE